MKRVFIILTLLSSALLFAAPTQPPAEPAIPADPERPLVWYDDFEKALNAAEIEFRSVFVLFTSPGCSWCERLKEGPLRDPDVVRVLSRFVPVMLDVSQDQQTAEFYQVRAVPRMMVLSSKGRILADLTGYGTANDLVRLLKRGLNPNDAEALDPDVEELVKLLKKKDFPADRWPEVMLALGDKYGRDAIHEAIFAMPKIPLKDLTSLLRDPRIAVRVGAIEVLDEVAGTSHGFDAWKPGSPENDSALAKFEELAGDKEMKRYSAYDAEKLQDYIVQLLSENRHRSLRAMQQLQRGGVSTIKSLQNYRETHPDLPKAADLKIREVQYGIYLSSLKRIDGMSEAHRLLWGNLDARLDAMRRISQVGSQAMPVLRDFMASEDPLIRETTVELICTCGTRGQVIPLLEEHLKSESNIEVLYRIVRGLAKYRSRRGLKLLTGFLEHKHEDLVIAAIESITSLKTKEASKQIGACLKDQRWRVRVAALEAAMKLNMAEHSGIVKTMLKDKDQFVRFTAVRVLPKLSGPDAKEVLVEAFEADDKMKPAVVAAFGSLDQPLPASCGRAIKDLNKETQLAVLGAMSSCKDDDLAFVAPLVDHEDLDVACSAIRLIARKGMTKSGYRKRIVDVLAGKSEKKILAVVLSLRLDYRVQPSAVAATPAVTQEDDELDDFVDAFLGPSEPKTKKKGPSTDDILAGFGIEEETPQIAKAEETKLGSADASEVVEALKACLTNGNREIQFAAAKHLARFNEPSALTFYSERLSSASLEERRVIADSLSGLAQDRSGLLRKLLNDPDKRVRKEAVVSAFSQHAHDVASVRAVFEQLMKPNSRLETEDAFNWRLDDLFEKHRPYGQVTKKPKTLEFCRMMLKSEKTEHQILGCIMASYNKDKKLQEHVEPFLKSSDPYLRRAAYHALAKVNRAAFEEKIDLVCNDSSELVREVLIGHCRNQDYWLHYLNKDTQQKEYSYDSTFMLSEKAVDGLRKLAEDASLRIRVYSFFTLLSNRKSVDLKKVVQALEQMPDQARAVEMVVEFMGNNIDSLGEPFRIFMPMVKKATDRGWKVQRIFKRFAVSDDDEDQEVQPLSLSLLARPVEQEEPLVAKLNAQPKTITEKEKDAPMVMVFFSSPGCKDCDRVKSMFRQLQQLFPQLKIEEHNIRKVNAMRRNESLCERFQVPDERRLVAPAVFTQAGFLIKTDVSYPAIAQMLARSSAMAPNDWHVLEDEKLVEAEKKIGKRYSYFSFAAVALAGLLDGINPCAFATIIFLLSYLQITQRSPRQTMQIGLAFIAGVFLAYFFLGLGLIEVVTRMSILQRLGYVLNLLVGGFALVIMVLSIRDGVLCMQGKLKDMTLQLPMFLKKRIHATIRHGARHTRFIIAAFVVGVIVSLLELACTGQVYAPTILFMLKTGQERTTALGHLTVYNLAFIAPLFVIFGLACQGLTNERLRTFMERHAAFVKFATAALFFTLFVFMVFGNRIMTLIVS